MKTIRILMVVIFSIAITACINGQIRRTVSGNGDVTREDRKAGDFSGLKVSTGIDVYLKQTADESITVEADENLLEYIRTEIRDGILNIYTDVNIRSAERKRVYVTMDKIESIRTTSAGDVVGETPVRGDNLELSASSAGNINLEVYAKELRVDISSSGDITLNGEVNILDASLSSAGDLNAYELKVREADVSASSAGDADISVSERLTARASSAGDINYRGDPKYIDAHSSSAGGVHRK